MSARRSAFLAVLLLAGSAAPICAGDVPGAKRPEPPKLDAFGDPLPIGASARFGSIRLRHQASALAFLNNETVVSVGSSIRVWAAPSGRLIAEHTHPKLAPTVGCVISGNGKVAVTGHENGVFRVWDTVSGRLIREFTTNQAPKAVEDQYPEMSISDDGKRLVSSYRFSDLIPKEVRVWTLDSSSGPIRLDLLKDDFIGKLALSPDGNRIAATTDSGGEIDISPEHTLAVWDASNGKQLRRDATTLGPIRSVQFSEDSKQMLVVGDKSIGLRTIEGKEVWRRPNFGPNTCAALGKLNRLIVLASNDGSNELTANLIDGPSGNARWATKMPIDGPRVWGNGAMLDFARSWAISPNGQLMAFVGDSGRLRLLELSNGKEIGLMSGRLNAVQTTCISSDGKSVVSIDSNGSEVVQWDMATSREVRRFKGWRGRCIDIELSADGTLLACASSDGMASIWEIASGRKVYGPLQVDEAVCSMRFIADGAKLAVASHRGVVTVFDFATSRRVHELPMYRGRHAIALICPSARRLYLVAVADGLSVEDQKIKGDVVEIWNVFSGQLIRELDGANDRLACCTLSPDCRTLCTRSGNGVIQLWELSSWRKRMQMEEKQGFGDRPGRQLLAYSPDGSVIASVNRRAGRVNLWDVSTGKQFGSLSGHDQRVNSLEYTPNSCRLLTGSDDTTILSWDMTRPEWRSRELVSKLTDEDLARHWDRLRNGTTEEAYRSKWALAGDPMKTVAFLRERLQPEQPFPIERVRAWIVDLDAAQYSVREHASRELLNHFDQAESELRAALKGTTSAEARKRLNQIIASAEVGIPEPDLLRDLRALEVLEQIGTPEARDVLRRLANDPVVTRISRDAAESLKRLEQRPR